MRMVLVKYFTVYGRSRAKLECVETRVPQTGALASEPHHRPERRGRRTPSIALDCIIGYHRSRAHAQITRLHANTHAVHAHISPAHLTAHTLYPPPPPPPPPDIALEMKPMSTWKAMSPKMTLPMFCCCSVRFGLGSLSTSDAPASWQVDTQQVSVARVPTLGSGGS